MMRLAIHGERSSEIRVNENQHGREKFEDREGKSSGSSGSS